MCAAGVCVLRVCGVGWGLGCGAARLWCECVLTVGAGNGVEGSCVLAPHRARAEGSLLRPVTAGQHPVGSACPNSTAMLQAGCIARARGGASSLKYTQTAAGVSRDAEVPFCTRLPLQ